MSCQAAGAEIFPEVRSFPSPSAVVDSGSSSPGRVDRSDSSGHSLSPRWRERTTLPHRIWSWGPTCDVMLNHLFEIVTPRFTSQESNMQDGRPIHPIKDPAARPALMAGSGLGRSSRHVHLLACQLIPQQFLRQTSACNSTCSGDREGPERLPPLEQRVHHRQ